MVDGLDEYGLPRLPLTSSWPNVALHPQFHHLPVGGVGEVLRRWQPLIPVPIPPRWTTNGNGLWCPLAGPRSAWCCVDLPSLSCPPGLWGTWSVSVVSAQSTLDQRIPNPFPGSGAAALTPAMPKSLDFLLRELVEHTSTGLVGSPRGKLFSLDDVHDILQTLWTGQLVSAAVPHPNQPSSSPGLSVLVDHTDHGNVHAMVLVPVVSASIGWPSDREVPRW